MTLLVPPTPFRVLHCDDSDPYRALVRVLLRPHSNLWAPDGERIVHAVTRLAAVLGLMTAADGVEDHQTAERLLALGVGHAQGAYLAPAGPAAAVLSRSSSRSAVTA